MHFGLASMFYKYEWNYNFWEQGRKETACKRLETVCCKRDSAAVQALVSGSDDFMLTVSRDPLFWKGGPLPVARLELQMDGGVRAEVKLIGLMEDDDRVSKSDVLLEQKQIFVERRKIQQVWVEVHTDESTPSGVYEGKLRLYIHEMFEEERCVEECSFSVTVKDWLLPEPADYRFYLDLWQHNSNIARKYDVELWSEDHFAILDHYLQALGALGAKAASVVVSEIPWSGQWSHRVRRPSDLFEYSMIKVTLGSDDKLSCDFSAMDRYIGLAAKYGIDKEIEVFGLLSIWQDPEAGYGAIVDGVPDGMRVRYYDESRGVYAFITEKEHLAEYIAALERHFVEAGWIEKVRVMADEPSDMELFRKRVDFLRETAPRLRYKIALDHAEFIECGINEIVDYVPILHCAAEQFERLMELRKTIPGKLMAYVCCNPVRPNTLLVSPPLESRLLPWLVEKWQLDGLLRWSFTAWSDNPLSEASYRYPDWKAGDLCLVYPGSRGRPLLSLRYKWLLRGIRDFELMQIRKAAGQAETVQALVDSVFYFDHPSELSPSSRKNGKELYSLTPEHYDRLLTQ
ncbi:DUF4091 domain-containing protein [Paenibacillus thalictri]|uniref:DUF4091 domain-containing protein n=1 Tax=Paenibacillus thalictri TaxID=2527873 RepID=A0A4Q9DIK1_9BACL|nr:DUF4091 domain-containing protein [Paenibacillus thalictri]